MINKEAAVLGPGGRGGGHQNPLKSNISLGIKISILLSVYSKENI